MDLTATRTRRICKLPLLLQVQKLKKTLCGHDAFVIYQYSYKYKNLKKKCKAYTLLTTNSIFRVTNFCSYILTAACADCKVIQNLGIVTLFIREVTLYQLFYMQPHGQNTTSRNLRTPRLRNMSKNL